MIRKNLGIVCVTSLSGLAMSAGAQAACLDHGAPNLEGATLVCAGENTELASISDAVEKIKIEAKFKSHLASSEKSSVFDCEYKFDLFIDGVLVKDPFDDQGRGPIAFLAFSEFEDEGNLWKLNIFGPKMFLHSRFQDGQLLESSLSDLTPFEHDVVKYPPVKCQLTLKSDS